ncbi:MAG: Xaa-Pro peptidase family protein [Actinomycetota bacterium]|nr:Xaa-Pro peptidase family protein [Actinomycetota bacterium]
MLEDKEFKRRRNNVVDILRKNDLKGALIYYDELNIGNGWYLSGWCPQFESGCILIVDTGNAYILGGPESEPFAKMDSAIKETRNITVFMVPDEEYPMAKIVTFKEVFDEVFGGSKLDKIGIVGMSTMPYGVYKSLTDDIKGIKLIDITSEYEELRVIKSQYEIDLMQKSTDITDEGFKAMSDAIKDGVSEIYVAGIADGKIRTGGANWFGYKTIVAAEERSNGVVPTASNRILRNGEMVLAGCSARYEGYASAASCSAIVGGKPSKEQKDYMKMVVEAYIMTREMLKPGMVGKENYAKIKKYFSDKGGYEKYVVCPFVHTCGLHEAEAPFFGPNSNDVIVPNMVINIDVSLWNVPKFNGIRFETGYLITEKGNKPFSSYMDKMIENVLDW